MKSVAAVQHRGIITRVWGRLLASETVCSWVDPSMLVKCTLLLNVQLLSHLLGCVQAHQYV